MIALPPGRNSDFDLLRDGKGVIDVDAQIPHRTFDLRVPEQTLNRAQIACATVDQGCLGPPERAKVQELRALGIRSLSCRNSVGRSETSGDSGLLDFFLAFGLGMTSAAGSPLQLFFDPPGSAAILALPWAVIPVMRCRSCWSVTSPSTGGCGGGAGEFGSRRPVLSASGLA